MFESSSSSQLLAKSPSLPALRPRQQASTSTFALGRRDSMPRDDLASPSQVPSTQNVRPREAVQREYAELLQDLQPETPKPPRRALDHALLSDASLRKNLGGGGNYFSNRFDLRRYLQQPNEIVRKAGARPRLALSPTSLKAAGALKKVRSTGALSLSRVGDGDEQV